MGHLQMMQGVSRKSGAQLRAQRSDIGRKRQLSENASSSEAAFLRARRKTQPGQSLARHTLKDEVAVWSSDHMKEMEFTIRKEQDRKLQAQQEGHLPVEESEAGQPRAAAERVQKIMANVRKRCRTARKRKTLRGGGGVTSHVLRGLKVFCRGSPDARAAGRRFQMQPTDKDSEAQAIITEPSKHNYKNVNLWVACFTGAFVVILPAKDPASSSTSARPRVDAVAILKYKSALRRPTSVYVTSAFRNSHPEHFEALQSCVQDHKPCAWRILRNRRAYALGDCRKGAKTLALVSESDRTREDISKSKTNIKIVLFRASRRGL